MSDEKQESLADIVADMRTKAECAKPYDDGIVMTLSVLADRIEAAAKRERAEIEANALAVGGVVEASRKREMSKIASKNGADFGQLGNTAAMREALDDIIDKIDTWRREDSMEHWQYSQLFDIADAALAAPARNCDVGTAEEQQERYHRTGETYHTLTLTNALEWAQMPYEEGGAK